MTSPSHPVNPIRLLLLSVSVAAAALVGTLPVSYYLHNRFLSFFLAAEAVIFVGAYLYSRRSDRPVSEGAGGLEYLLRALSAISLWGFLGVMTLGLNVGFSWFFRLIARLVAWFSGSQPFDTANIAFYFTFGVAALFGLGIAAAIGESIATRIYSVSSSRNVEYSKTLSEQSRTYLYLMLNLIALAAMVFLVSRFGGKGGFFFHLVLQLIPYLGSFWVLNLGTRVYSDSEVVERIGRVLRAMDFEVVFSPRTIGQELQSLLAGVDMLATRTNEAYIIQVKTASSSASDVDWTTGSGLRIKAATLRIPEIAEKVAGASLSNKNVIPLLIICGRKQDPSLAEFLREQELQVVMLDSEAMNLLPAIRSDAELIAFGEKYFPQMARTAVATGIESDMPVIRKGEQWA
jgi:hypothetical protein